MSKDNDATMKPEMSAEMDDFGRAKTDPSLEALSVDDPIAPAIVVNPAAENPALDDTLTPAQADDSKEDLAFDDTMVINPNALAAELARRKTEAAKPKVDPSEHTRELPVIEDADPWFIYKNQIAGLGIGTEITIEGKTVQILDAIGIQSYERRYKVSVEGDAKPRVLKHGVLAAPFVRYALEAQALKATFATKETGLPQVHLYEEREGHGFLVMDAPIGVPYAQILKGNAKPYDHAKILQALAATVGGLHRHGYVVTSLRPSSFNVISVDGEFQVHLHDLLNICETVEKPKYPLASEYTGPEVAELSPADEGADLFSIGALLYRAVTKSCVPFEKLGGVFIAEHDAASKPMIAQILARSLSSPSDRFFDVSEMLVAFEQLIEELVPRIRPVTAMLSSTGINPMRLVNQDSCAMSEMAKIHKSVSRHLGYYVVADGMGGHEDGDKASELSIRGAVRYFHELAMDMDHDEWRENQESVVGRIAAAGSRLLVDTVGEDGKTKRMGTTFTSLLVVDNRVSMAHLGDSRAILFRDNKVTYLSEDHSLVGMMVKAGQLTEEEAEEADEKNILMRSLGAESEARPETFDGLSVLMGKNVITAKKNDCFVLMSDGVWGMIPRPEMHALLAAGGSPDAICRRLCDEAIQRGGMDNVAVVTLCFADVTATP